MVSERSPKLPVVAEAETALRSLGVRSAPFHQRPVGRGHWFADWSGGVSGSEVYVAITGKTSTTRTVRLLLDAWIFEDVATRDLGEVLSQIFSGGASLRKKRSLLMFPAQTLKVSIGRRHYSATRRLTPDEELSPWERALITGS